MASSFLSYVAVFIVVMGDMQFWNINRDLYGFPVYVVTQWTIHPCLYEDVRKWQCFILFWFHLHDCYAMHCWQVTYCDVCIHGILLRRFLAVLSHFIRAQRLSWLGHIERTQGTRMVKAIYSWKPVSRRPTGRPKTHWGDDVRKDIQKIKVPNWKTLAQDRRRWKELVEKAKTI